jgi:hypothetical protein
MKQLMLVVSCVSSVVFAQAVIEDDDGNVDVVVPGAAVQVRQGGAATSIVVPGAAVQTQVQVRGSQTTVVTPGVVVQQLAPVIVRERVIVQQPVLVQQPVVVQQPVLARDCGAGPNDPGCLLRKNGQLPMEGVAFQGALKSLRAQRNTITREEMATKMLGRVMLTAAQLGLVIDAFADHGITQLDVAKTLAPNVVNPQHALGHSTKFTNSISAEEYVEAISAQSAGQ